MTTPKLRNNVRTFLETEYGFVTRNPKYSDTDIDFWAGDDSYSVKRSKHGEFIFELELYHGRLQKWFPSWYQTGNPTYYIFVTDDNVHYQIDRKRLNEYVNTHGWEWVVKVPKHGMIFTKVHDGVITIDTAMNNGLATIM